MKETSIEVKVGALVLFSLALLVGFIFVLGDFSLSDGFEFDVHFENAGGLKPGADVAIAGLNVGNVKRLQFIENSNREGMNAVAVKTTLSIDKRYADAVRQNSEFFITTRGVLGEPYIEIVTETYEEPPIAAGAVMRGVDPPRMDLVVSRAMKLLKIVTDLLEDPKIATRDLFTNVSELVSTINDILNQNRPHIDGTIAGAHTSMDEAGKLLGSLNVAIEDGEAVKAMVGDLRVASNDLRVTARNARRLTDRVDGRVDPILQDVEVTAENARQISASVNRILVDNEPSIQRTITNVEQSTENLRGASEDTRLMVAEVKGGEGTVGQLLNDREIYDDLKEIMRQIKRKPWKIMWKE